MKGVLELLRNLKSDCCINSLLRVLTCTTLNQVIHIGSGFKEQGKYVRMLLICRALMNKVNMLGCYLHLWL